MPAAVSVVEQYSLDGLAVSIITVGELYEGIYGYPDEEERLADLRNLVSDYTVMGLTDSIMLAFAWIRFDLRRRGQRISDLDMLIAATAIVNDLTLITRNLQHFSRIQDLRIFTVMDDG